MCARGHTTSACTQGDHLSWAWYLAHRGWCYEESSGAGVDWERLARVRPSAGHDDAACQPTTGPPEKEAQEGALSTPRALGLGQRERG